MDLANLTAGGGTRAGSVRRSAGRAATAGSRSRSPTPSPRCRPPTRTGRTHQPAERDVRQAEGHPAVRRVLDGRRRPPGRVPGAGVQRHLGGAAPSAGGQAAPHPLEPGQRVALGDQPSLAARAVARAARGEGHGSIVANFGRGHVTAMCAGEPEDHVPSPAVPAQPGGAPGRRRLAEPAKASRSAGLASGWVRDGAALAGRCGVTADGTFVVGRRLFFFFNDTATTEIYTLSLHDALPI